MIKQTLTWTALPRASAGPLAAGTELRLSVFVAPRLWNDDPTVTTMPLGDFPDWLDWPALIAQASFQVEFAGGPTLAATAENVGLRSDLWQALFKPTTTVRPFAFEDLSGVTLLSFPASTVHDSIRGIYGRIATESGTDLPGRGTLAADPDLVDIARPVEPLVPWVPPETDRGPVLVGDPVPPEEDEEEKPDEEEEEPLAGCGGGCLGCLGLPFRLLRRLFNAVGITAFPLPMMREAAGPGGRPPMGVPPPPPSEVDDAPPVLAENLSPPAPRATSPARSETRAASAQQAAFDDLHAFVQPNDLVSRPLPTATEVEDTYDFHQMISSLGDYPNLTRYLGLVVDLVVTLDAALPAAQGTVRIVPTLPLATATTHTTPRTHYELGDGRFLARPRAGADLANGLLRLDDDSRFRVLLIEVAGSGLKLQNTATNVVGLETLAAWPPNAPEEAGLPALQTAGVGIVRQTQILELVRRFDHNFALNRFLAAADGSAVPAYGAAGPPPDPSDELFAEDLVRGYRLDVLDDRANQWRSLNRRIGTYEFLDGPLTLANEEDEGFVQLASTEPLAGGPQRELKVHESLGTWDGWSLAAPRPGQTLLPDHTTGHAANPAVTQFKLETAFRARPGSLPRLRFGWSYRVRARAVDLAGNSPFGPDDAAFADTPAEATPLFPFTRFEPVAPPSLVLRAVPVEGESLEHLVVRSTIHDPPATIVAQTSERHLVPPKGSQLMAERHGIFDASPGMLKDQAAYDLASREAGSLTHRLDLVTGDLEPIPGTVEQEPSPGRVYWLQTHEQFEVAFLPDPFARGVLLLGLPGMAAPDAVVDDVNRITFGGAWPDLTALRLRLQGLDAGALAAAPAWDAVDRVLTVEVPQGETFRVRYSCFFAAADLPTMGAWRWVEEGAPADLATLEQQAAAGRNWLLSPYRELVLTHAVQQPLAIPVASALAIAPAKGVGDTSIGLAGQVDIDAKSTGKVDLRAAWTDPLDDPAQPAFDALTDVLRHEMHVAEVTAYDPADDSLAVTGVTHALGDTKYHQVTYTPVATTRFREYFPPAVLANPEDLVRPTPAEVGTPPADGARFVLDVPNSARPAAVSPRYVLPVFAWSETDNAGVHTRVRRTGLRLYMDRPWFSSGAGELLGLVLRPPAVAPLSDNWMTLRQYVSEWGMDPIWRAEDTAPLAAGDFANAAAQQGGLTLAELPGLTVGAIGFEPRYDVDRNLWRCDIELDAGQHYFPFVRLALARFHPISVPDAHLSRVVLSDFIQVPPHRTVAYDLTQLSTTRLVEITVNGPAYFHREDKPFDAPLMVARLERRRFDTGDEIGWETVATAPLAPVERVPANTVWHGRLQLPDPPPSPARIVVLEAEAHRADPPARHDVASFLGGVQAGFDDDQPPDSTVGRRDLAARVVFADAIELP